jgi:hypothetical protein
MVPNRLAFVALALGCIAAAAGGGYLATRQNSVPTPAAAAATSSPVASPTPASTAPASSAVPTTTAGVPNSPVHETEAVVGDQPTKTPEPDEPKPAHGPRAKAEPVRPSAPAKSAKVLPQQTLPPLDRSWPTGAPGPTGSAAAQPPIAPPAPPNDDRTVQEPVRTEPPQKSFEELVLPSESVIGLQTETALSSERARVEDRVEAHVTRDVRVNGQVAIPAGSKAIGSVSQVERGGKFKERSRLGIRFHTLVLADGTRLPINTETIIREGSAPEAAQKVGVGAVGGAILGAILGGAKGAAVGAAAGAGGGAAVQMAGDRNAATLPLGSALTVRVVSPVTITIEKN